MNRASRIVPEISTRLKLVKENEFEYPEVTAIFSPLATVRFVRQHFIDLPREQFMTIHLNTAHKVIGFEWSSKGGLAASIIEPRLVFTSALLKGSACVICVHNHPSGNTEPSREDMAVTKQLVAAGRLIGIPVRDHIIVGDLSLGDTEYTSLAERGMLE